MLCWIGRLLQQKKSSLITDICGDRKQQKQHYSFAWKGNERIKIETPAWPLNFQILHSPSKIKKNCCLRLAQQKRILHAVSHSLATLFCEPREIILKNSKKRIKRSLSKTSSSSTTHNNKFCWNYQWVVLNLFSSSFLLFCYFLPSYSINERSQNTQSLHLPIEPINPWYNRILPHFSVVVNDSFFLFLFRFIWWKLIGIQMKNVSIPLFFLQSSHSMMINSQESHTTRA